MDLQFGSNFTRLRVAVGVNKWSEYVDEDKKSVREQPRRGCRIQQTPDCLGMKCGVRS